MIFIAVVLVLAAVGHTITYFLVRSAKRDLEKREVCIGIDWFWQLMGPEYKFRTGLLTFEEAFSAWPQWHPQITPGYHCVSFFGNMAELKKILKLDKAPNYGIRQKDGSWLWKGTAVVK